jgi:TetR/AcrR family transcriptional regulator, tetracycline repressor protein
MYSTCVARSPGQRAGISRTDVVAAARTILHAEGLPAVSMRRVAVALGVAPNALYSHVPDKDALIDLLLDAVLADLTLAPRGNWRDRVETVLADTRRVLLANPDLVPFFLSRQTIGPNALRAGEVILDALHQGGVRGEDAVRAFQVLLAHTIGATAFEIGRRGDPNPAARQRRGQDTIANLDTAEFPRTTAQGAAMSKYPGDTVFRLGLRLLLDGLTTDQRRPTRA